MLKISLTAWFVVSISNEAVICFLSGPSLCCQNEAYYKRLPFSVCGHSTILY